MKYISFLFPLLLTLAACSSAADGPEMPLDAEKSVSLSFSMQTSGEIVNSRADDAGHAETDSEYLAFENGVDISDLTLMVFARMAGSTDSPKLVYKLTDLTKSDDARIQIIGTDGNYLVNLMILRDNLKEILGGYQISPNGNGVIQFRLLMLANCSAAGGNINDITATDYDAVLNQLAAWSFPMTAFYNSTTAADITEIYKGHVPMFGSNVFAASEAALYNSRPEDRIFLGQIDLLRCLSKVRVVDNMLHPTLGYPRIASAQFISSQDHTRLLPYNVSAYQNGQQVHTPNPFTEQDVNQLPQTVTYNLGVMPDIWVRPAAPHTGSVFVGYMPEQLIGHQNNDLNSGMPMFRLTVENRKADGTIETTLFDVPMTSYKDTNFTFGDAILRNHIYTLSVNGMGTDLDVTVELVPYRACVLEPYFGLEPK